jgi:hypothetical protein
MQNLCYMFAPYTTLTALKPQGLTLATEVLRQDVV